MNLRGYALSVWEILDPLYYAFTRLTYLNKNEEKSCVFRVRLTRYLGRPITLADGTDIRKNDLLVKVHLHNVRILRAMSKHQNELQKARHLYKLVESSLPEVASYVRNHPEYDNIKGLVGITLLNKACHRLGFETFSIQSKVYRWFKLTALYPISLLSASNNLSSTRIPDPMYLIMNKETLLQRYNAK